MALYRQGSGSVQVDRVAFRAYEHQHGNGSSTRYTADIFGNASARTPFKLNRGKRFSRVARIRQCSIGVLVLIIFFIVGITLLGSNYRFRDRGDQNPSESGKFYDNQGHSIHFAIWNLRGHDPLAGKDKKKENSGDGKIPNQGDMRKHGHNSVDVGDSYISKVLQFGQGSVGSSQDSRDWDRDDRRRGKVFSERDSEFSDSDSMSVFNQETIDLDKGKKNNAGDSLHSHQRTWIKESKQDKDNAGARQFKDQKRHVKSTGKPDGENFGNGGLYNEKGRDELKLYEAQYEEALKNELGQNEMGKADRADSFNNEHEKTGFVKTGNQETHLLIEGGDSGSLHMQDVSGQQQVDVEDEYDDGIDEYDIHAEEAEGLSSDRDIPDVLEKQDEHQPRYGKNMHKENPGFPKQKGLKRVLDNDFDKESSLFIHGFHQDKVKGNIASVLEPRDSLRKADTENKRTSLTRRSKRHKHASTSCELRFLDSSVRPVEPKENPKFAKFSLQFVEREEKPDEVDDWVPRFAGHQSLEEREDSFYARDQKLTCGFVKGPKGSPSTGFDLSEEDTRFLNSCHIAVSSCIFGNSDNLRTPTGKKVTRSSKKNVCFVMFVDEKTLGTMSLEGRQPDEKGFIGLWRVVVVRNLPYMDMRRTGKVPKFLTHRLFPSARYSIWLDSKLRLQSDPLLILEYFLWRRGYEYAISNHYDRHCVWEEVMQNKHLNKFNHTIIDEQFAFYQADGLTRFNSSDPSKLLPSHVPEGSFIVRAHTPMSNLFSCLWFNEVDRFTPRDQLSFAYTYLKLQRMNPEKYFHLNMFKDCERRGMAKLFHHRTDEKNLN